MTLKSTQKWRHAYSGALEPQKSAGCVFWTWPGQFWQDLGYAARGFRRSPGFTLGAVIVLALGVGVNISEFLIFDAAMFHRLSIQDPASIFKVSRIAKNKQSDGIPYEMIRVYQENCGLCAAVISEDTSLGVTINGETHLLANFVSGNYFKSLGITPVLGRLLVEMDDLPTPAPVVILGYQYWKSHYEGDSSVLGHKIQIDGQLFQVVGITPYNFNGLETYRWDVWLPAGWRSILVPPLGRIGASTVADHMLFVKPRKGEPLQAVEAQLTSISHSLSSVAPPFFLSDERDFCQRLPGSGMDLTRLPPPAFLIVALVALVLLSACANLGNMLVARGFGRQRELDTRAFLGADSGRLIRQSLTESLLLSFFGSAAGLPLGLLAGAWLMHALDVPPDIRINPTWALVLPGLVLTFVSTLAFGLPPVLQIAKRKYHKTGSQRQLLVATQVAISCLLVIVSAVLARGAIQSATINLAFDYPRMIIVTTQLASEHLSAKVARQRLDGLVERFGNLPGVASVTESVTPPLGHRSLMRSLPALPSLSINPVSPTYFMSLKLPLLRGRTFRASDANAVIVSEGAARSVWPNQDPLGKMWNVENATRTVVGVVKDSGANLIVNPESVEVYVPETEAWVSEAALIVHVRDNPALIAREIMRAGASSGEPLWAELMGTAHQQVIDSQRKLLIIVGSLGVVATCLAASGMFALIAFAVAQRRREIGIRIAIGAGPGAILASLLKQNFGPIVFGVVAGSALAAVLGKVAHGLVEFQTDRLDPLTFLTGIVAFSVIASLATVLPSLKALRIDPAATLRSS